MMMRPLHHGDGVDLHIPQVLKRPQDAFLSQPKRRFAVQSLRPQRQRPRLARCQRHRRNPLAFHFVMIKVTFMAVNTQFSIAVHVMAALGFNCGVRDIVSANLAQSVNTSPSFVRRILAKLSKAGLVSAARGKSGCSRLARPPEKISLLDIYLAVDAPKVFAIHSYPEQKACSVSCRIKSTLEQTQGQAQKSLEASLASVTLADLLADLKAS